MRGGVDTGDRRVRLRLARIVDVWKDFRSADETLSSSGAAGFTNPSQPPISPCMGVFSRVIHLGRRVPTNQRIHCLQGTPRRCDCHSFPVPVTLPKHSRACPRCLCLHVLTLALTAETGARNTQAALEQRSKQYWRRTAMSRERSRPNLYLALLCVNGHA